MTYEEWVKHNEEILKQIRLLQEKRPITLENGDEVQRLFEQLDHTDEYMERQAEENEARFQAKAKAKRRRDLADGKFLRRLEPILIQTWAEAKLHGWSRKRYLEVVRDCMDDEFEES